MSSGRRAALRVWRSRRTTSSTDWAYYGYAGVLALLAAGWPAAIAVREAALGPDVQGVLRMLTGLASTCAGTILNAGITVIFAVAAYAVGRVRGPLILPTFLARSLLYSDITAERALGPSLLRAAVMACAVTTSVSTFAAWAAWQGGVIAGSTVAMWAFGGAGYGLALTCVWLTGQIGLPGSKRWFDPEVVVAQSARWATATSAAYVVRFGDAAETYAPKARYGRSLQAVVGPGRPAARWLRRSAVGALRTPVPTLGALTVVVVAGAVFAVAPVPFAPAPLIGAAVSAMLYLSAGPLTQALQHAVRSVRGHAVLGGSRVAILAHASIFPMLVITAGLAGGLLLGSALFGPLIAAGPAGTAVAVGSPGAAGMAGVAEAAAAATTASAVNSWFMMPILPIVLLALTTVSLRIMHALRGSVPFALLTPMPTPAGDMSIVLQLVWSGGRIISAACIGAGLLAVWGG